MARITVEDCLAKIDNRFELTLVAARRARQLAAGARPTIPLDKDSKDKNTVIALREVAAGTITKAILDEPAPPPLASFPGASRRAAAEIEDVGVE